MNEVAKAAVAEQQIDSGEQAAINEDETFSETEEETKAEENAINDEDNVVPFG